MPELDVCELNGYHLKPSPVLVEFSLKTPISKTKSKQIVFTLLATLNINDEFEINSINYLTDGQFSLIQKISIQFRFQNGIIILN